MLKRAENASTVEGMGELANTVASFAVSKMCSTSAPSATALIRHLVASTNPTAYAAACRAIASAPSTEGHLGKVPCSFVGGAEDYLAPPDAVAAWADETGSSYTIVANVGHWGPLEAPDSIGRELGLALNPR